MAIENLLWHGSKRLSVFGQNSNQSYAFEKWAKLFRMVQSTGKTFGYTKIWWESGKIYILVRVNKIQLKLHAGLTFLIWKSFEARNDCWSKFMFQNYCFDDVTIKILAIGYRIKISGTSWGCPQSKFKNVNFLFSWSHCDTKFNKNAP